MVLNNVSNETSVLLFGPRSDDHQLGIDLSESIHARPAATLCFSVPVETSRDVVIRDRLGVG